MQLVTQESHSSQWSILKGFMDKAQHYLSACLELSQGLSWIPLHNGFAA